ncbi:hypothetical protein R1sor_006869 [Riccia sorocarpa]|uniref:Uncharacterized protein n=1 Tax=Riccia sorocarpa TaxID=122646 RepID=A0ABD3HP64_9MARC
MDQDVSAGSRAPNMNQTARLKAAEERAATSMKTKEAEIPKTAAKTAAKIPAKKPPSERYMNSSHVMELMISYSRKRSTTVLKELSPELNEPAEDLQQVTDDNPRPTEYPKPRDENKDDRKPAYISIAKPDPTSTRSTNPTSPTMKITKT